MVSAFFPPPRKNENQPCLSATVLVRNQTDTVRNSGPAIRLRGLVLRLPACSPVVQWLACSYSIKAPPGCALAGAKLAVRIGHAHDLHARENVWHDRNPCNSQNNAFCS